MTHLVEHLTLFPFGQQPFEYNGIVDPIRTMFVASGNETEVVNVITTVCRNLASLPLDRLVTEQRVLRDEGSRHPVGPAEHHAWLRWGPAGPGLTFIPEFGLRRTIEHDEVAAWSSRWFTAGNAALVWIGPELPSFDLGLPAGDRRLPALVHDLIDTPTWAIGAPEHVAVSFSVARGSAEAASQRILTKRLQQQLRYERGLSYDITMLYQPLSAAKAHSIIWASCGTGDAAAARDVVVQTAVSLARDGPTLEELAADLDAMRRMRENPASRHGEADRLAIQELLGAEPDTLEQLETELAAVTPAQARDAFAASVQRLLVTNPENVPGPEPWLQPYPNLIAGPPPAGRRFVDVREPSFDFRKKFPTLVVGDKAIGIEMTDGSGLTIPWSRAAAVVYSEDGLITVFHDSGSDFAIYPGQWRDGRRLPDLLATAVPADRLVRFHDQPAPWIFSGQSPLSIIATLVGSFVLAALAIVTLDAPGVEPQPVEGGLKGYLGGFSFIAAALLLPVMTYGARSFRSWSWLAALAVAALCVIGGLLVSTGWVGIAAWLIGLLPAAHVWKVKLRRLLKRPTHA